MARFYKGLHTAAFTSSPWRASDRDDVRFLCEGGDYFEATMGRWLRLFRSWRGCSVFGLFQARLVIHIRTRFGTRIELELMYENPQRAGAT